MSESPEIPVISERIASMPVGDSSATDISPIIPAAIDLSTMGGVTILANTGRSKAVILNGAGTDNATGGGSTASDLSDERAPGGIERTSTSSTMAQMIANLAAQDKQGGLALDIGGASRQQALKRVKDRPANINVARSESDDASSPISPLIQFDPHMPESMQRSMASLQTNVSTDLHTISSADISDQRPTSQSQSLAESDMQSFATHSDVKTESVPEVHVEPVAEAEAVVPEVKKVEGGEGDAESMVAWSIDAADDGSHTSAADSVGAEKGLSRARSKLRQKLAMFNRAKSKLKELKESG
ncbi:hypothetical protein FBU59_005893, partial [Linderina macrospora]